MDVVQGFDVETIGVLSSIITVFCMSVVSIGKQMLAKSRIPFQIAISLAVGSVDSGYLGQWMLRVIVTVLNAQGLVTVVQNALLARPTTIAPPSVPSLSMLYRGCRKRPGFCQQEAKAAGQLRPVIKYVKN